MTIPTPTRIQAHWLLLAMWLALLAALVYTAAHGLPMAYSGTTDALQLLTNASLQGIVQPNVNAVIYTAAGLVGSVAVPAVFMIAAWLRFVELTRDLLVSFAKVELGEPLRFARWLVFQPEAPDEVEPDAAEHTTVGQVLRPLAFAWIAILLMPPVLGSTLLVLLYG